MKILEAQSAVLSNYEVYQHLADQKYRYKQGKHRGPSNLEMVVRDTLQYLRSKDSPLGKQPLTYTPDCIAKLLEKLRPYELSKGEVVMIINIRPGSIAALNTVIEDMPERFTEDQQGEMLEAIADVLGHVGSGESQTRQNGEPAGDDAPMEDA